MSRPGPRCTICAHPRRADIEHAFVSGLGRPAVAKKFGVDAQAAYRHFKNHLSPVQKAEILTATTRLNPADLERLRVTESESLLSNLVGQRARLLEDGDNARAADDVNAAVRVEGAIRENLALTGKLLGAIIQKHEVSHTNLLVSPDYIQLRAALVTALKPYPEAALAVGQALRRMESEAAAVIKGESPPAEPGEVIDLPAILPPKPLPPPPPPPPPRVTPL